jgi:hypothetical protein
MNRKNRKAGLGNRARNFYENAKREYGWNKRAWGQE